MSLHQAIIEGVELKPLTDFNDDRGSFRELIRATDPFFAEGFGQLSTAVVYPGVAKAWHIHQIQVDWWYVLSGVFKVALHDTREGSRTFRTTMEFLMGDHQPAYVLRIPPGVAHGYRCVAGPGVMLYVTSKVYDPADEGRIAHDDPTIGYDWRAEAPIK